MQYKLNFTQLYRYYIIVRYYSYKYSGIIDHSPICIRKMDYDRYRKEKNLLITAAIFSFIFEPKKVWFIFFNILKA